MLVQMKTWMNEKVFPSRKLALGFCVCLECLLDGRNCTAMKLRISSVALKNSDEPNDLWDVQVDIK